MEFLRNLRGRSEGCDDFVDYGYLFNRLKCTVWETSEPFIESSLLSCSFAKKSQKGHILAACCENGQIIIVNTKLMHCETSFFTISSLHNNALFSSVWSDIDMKVLTASGDHTVKLCDVDHDGKLNELNSFRAHRCSVKTASFRPLSSDVFATGGRDGNIFVWDARSNEQKPEQCIINCHPKIINKRESSCVTWLLFQDDVKLISCADAETNINFWDLRKTYLRTMDHPKPLYQLKPKEENDSLKGYSHMAINKSGTELFANRFNNTIYTFNLSSYSTVPEFKYYGHLVNTCYNKISLSPDGKYLAGSDSNNKIYIWRLRSSSDPVVVLGGQFEGLSDVAWCPEDPLMLATSSDEPFPWIWTVSKNSGDNSLQTKHAATCSDTKNSQCPCFHSYASRLINPATQKNKKKRLMNPYSLKNAERKELLSMLMLPNTAVDGYQIHVCAEVEKRKLLTNNWLTNIHDQQMKRILFDRSAKKGLKRKRSTSMSPCNNLNKYFKRTNENSLLMSTN